MGKLKRCREEQWRCKTRKRQELYRELWKGQKVPEEQILKRYGVKSLSELDEVSRKRALNGLKQT